MAAPNNVRLEEIKNEGLLVEWKVTIPAADIVSKLDEQLLEEQKTFKMAGYTRPGSVPLNMIRKQLGPNILSKIIETKVDKTLKDIFEEKGVQPALQPIVEIKSFDEKTDLVFNAKIEFMPKLSSINWEDIGIEIDVYKVKVMAEDIIKAHDDILNNFKNFEAAPGGHAARKNDAVVIDFKGTINGEEFDGNKGEDIRLEIKTGDSAQFIPGFEEQLIGAKVNMNLKVRAQFPKDYGNKKVAGKTAIFDVKVKQVLVPQKVEKIDDEFAKKLGLESLEKLNEMIEKKIEADLNGLGRLRMKKTLFDKIDAHYKFDIPPGMLAIDFDAMWKEIEQQMRSNPAMFKDKNKEDLKKEYMEIAKRRVRLGILLAETAKENKIEITDNDIQQAIYSEAMLRPGQEKIVLDYYSKPENTDRLKGPILEEKAVDFILTKIKKNEIEVTSKEFFEKYAEELDKTANTTS